MGFEQFLGNERVKGNLISSLQRGRISHFYLISGPAGSGKHTLANLLAAAILCRNAQNKPCLSCPACRKVMDHAHPDFITVDDPEKKTVSVELIRQARADMFVQPNESEHKIYLLPRAQDMNLFGQNALLKVLEEPPSYGVFILLTDNPQKLLPTVRSRCTELALTMLPDEVLRQKIRKSFPNAQEASISAAIFRSGGYLGQALSLMQEEDGPQSAAFADCYASRNTMALLRVLVPMERWKRDALIHTLEQWLEILHAALLSRSGMTAVPPLSKKIAGARSSQELLSGIQALQKSIEYAQGNVSPAAVCGYLEWALRS